MICRECGWHQGYTDADGYSAANGMTLAQGRANVAAHGSCEQPAP